MLYFQTSQPPSAGDIKMWFRSDLAHLLNGIGMAAATSGREPDSEFARGFRAGLMAVGLGVGLEAVTVPQPQRLAVAAETTG